jgi:hypothetical protein
MRGIPITTWSILLFKKRVGTRDRRMIFLILLFGDWTQII